MYFLVNMSKSIKHILQTISLNIIGFSLVLTTLFSSCEVDDPQREDAPELITQAVLTFTPYDGGAAVVVTATDPDGDGVQDIAVDGAIDLAVNKTYILTISLINGLASPADPSYDITAEVDEESDEHLFFYAWTNNVFADPAGDGNVDNRADDVNYNDEDVNGLPLGLSTIWTTAGNVSAGDFRVILKHQPGLKSQTSSSSDGETDLDLTFVINTL